MKNDTLYEEVAFEGLTLEGEELVGARFDGCTFRRVELQGALLRRCVFDDCRFVHCDLSNVRLPDARLRDVRFEDSKLIGVDFTRAQPLGLELRFERCLLRYASFVGMSLEGLALLECQAQEVDFGDANLEGAVFTGSALAGALFDKTRLVRADLSGAEDVTVNPTQNRLGETKLALDAAIRAAVFVGIEVPDVA